MKNKNFKAFTLIEILMWILIVSLVMIWWFEALTAVSFGKVKLIQQTQMEKQSFYFVEKFFEMIKKWWVIDYEEYFNRKIVWNTSFSGGHYKELTWFGNFWAGWSIWTTTYWGNFYYCISWNWTWMWTWGCVNYFNTWSLWLNEDYSLKPQRYWQYSYQFIDYNANFNGDSWDEDWDGKIIWDYDDEYIWIWPSVFSWGIALKELYLISWNKKERTLFRWNVIQDPSKDIPTWMQWCKTFDGLIFTGSCLGNIQFLKLSWEDWWMNHNRSGFGTYDWVIDTWIINKEFNNGDIVAWSNANNYWVDLFPKDINVIDFKIFAYPNNDVALNWRNTTEDSNISPYIRIQFKLLPSWWSRKKMKWTINEIKYSTTINLTNIFSN